MSTGSTARIVLSALMRARFCELLPPKIKHGETDLFLLGLLSLMDSILEIQMSEVLEKVPIDQETKAVLLGGNSHLGPLYQLMLAQESGDWQHSAELAKCGRSLLGSDAMGSEDDVFSLSN
jgi:c-di-GMP phosphodiesterase